MSARNKHYHTQAEVAADILLDTISLDAPWPTSWEDTPKRFGEAWKFWTSGYAQDPAAELKVFEEEGVGDGMIFQGSIPFFSLCQHHLVPFFGICHIGYIPHVEKEVVESRLGPLLSGRMTSSIVGLSKLPRLVEIFARRLQVQERATCQIADAFMEHVNPQGCGVVMRARHLCVESRGVQKIGTNTTTSALRGLFLNDPEVRAEFFNFVATADAGVKSL